MSSRARDHHLIANLLGDPTLTHVEIASMVGCSTKKIQRVAKKILEEAEGNPDVLEVFKKQLERRLSIAKCAEEHVRLIEQNDHLPTKLAAIKRYQEIVGIVTPKESREKPRQQITYQPMIRVDTHVDLTGNGPVTTVEARDASLEARTEAPALLEARKGEVVDVEVGTAAPERKVPPCGSRLRPSGPAVRLRIDNEND